MKVLEFAFTAYPVTDMARARAFYEGILGLVPCTVHDSEKGRWTEYELGAGTFCLGQAPGWTPFAEGPSIALEVDDFDASIALLREKGVAFAMEPLETPVCRMASIADPEGNAVLIHKRHPGHH